MNDKFSFYSLFCKQAYVFFFAVLFILFTMCNGMGAPIRPIGPLDVGGTVSDLKWYPKKVIKGIPGMSGSAGHDRIMPAHFLVTLSDFNGVDSQTAVAMTRYIDWSVFKDKGNNFIPPFVILMINNEDQNYFKKGMKTNVSGYTIRGDEGGTWTYFRSIDILNQQSRNDDVRNYLEANIESPNSGGKMFCSYDLFGKETKHGTQNLYLWTTCMEYYVKDGTLRRGVGVSLPAVLIAEKKFRGYLIRRHLIPKDGEDYSENIRRIFPPMYHALIFSETDEYDKRAEQLLNDTEKKAREYYGLIKEQNISRDGLKLIDFKVNPIQMHVGDSLTVSFILKNETDQPLKINPEFGIFVGTRWNSITDDNNRDFGHKYKGKIIMPGSEIAFLAIKKLDAPGIWRFWPAYNINGHWGPFRWNEIVVEVGAKSSCTSCPHTDFHQ